MAISKTKRKIIINVAVILCVTALTFVYLFLSGNVKWEDVKAIGFSQYLFVFTLFVLSLLLVSLVDFFVYRSFTKSMNYGKCVLNTLYGNLGSAVTPLKSGHFPMMIYYQYNANVPIKDTATGLVKCQIIYSITTIVLYSIMSIALAVSNVVVEINQTTIKLYLVLLIGLAFHLGVFLLIVFMALNKRFQNFVLKVCASLLYKLKKIEDKQKFIEEKAENLLVFKKELTIIGKGWYKYFAPIICFFIYMIILNSLQYASYLTFTKKPFNLSEAYMFYALTIASSYITNVIPLPGGFGTSELMFTIMFSLVIEGGTLGSILVLWRVATYYVVIAIELIVFIVVSLINSRKRKIPL